MLSRLVIIFLPRSKSLNFMTTVTICSDFGAQENKICHCLHFFPFYLPGSDGAGCHDFSVFLMMNFKPTFQFPLSPSSRDSSISTIRMLSSAYLRLLIFLLAFLISACGSHDVLCIEVK